MKNYLEPARTLPVVGNCEVLVAGAGPAGIGAALGAARCGASVILLEAANCVGGMATAGMMSHWCDGTESPLLDEIFERTNSSPLLPPAAGERTAPWATAHEAQKTAVQELLLEAGVTLQYHTRIAGAVVEDNTVKGVITESKSGREVILAHTVIDATGDGDVAAAAGAEFVLGRPEDHGCQPVTLMFRIGGVDHSRAIFPGSFESLVDVPKGEIQALGHEHLPFPAGHVLLYPAPLPGEVCVNMTNVTGVNATDVRELTRAELTCREQMVKIVQFLREFAPGYENCYAVTSAANVGVRETRHFKALYQLNETDIVEARTFDDWIATRNHFNFDIHNVKGPGLDANGAQHKFRSRGKYTIPYRSCVPEKLDGLLLSGRNIDGTHKAHSNFRVMPICLNIGQGTGVAAALAARNNIPARAVDVKAVQAELMKMGIRP